MAHMVETMAYAGELPWHGLGTKVIDDLTPEQMMQKAGVDWTVEKQDMITSGGSTVKSKQALVRSSDGEVLDIVGKGWNPVQNADAFNFFEDYVKAGDMQMHTAGSLNGGKVRWFGHLQKLTNHLNFSMVMLQRITFCFQIHMSLVRRLIFV